MLNVGDKVKILDNDGELANHTLEYLETMDIDYCKFISYHFGDYIADKTGTIIKIDTKQEVYFIQLDGTDKICAMFEDDWYEDGIKVYLEIVE